jgi:hypothetical protein
MNVEEATMLEHEKYLTAEQLAKKIHYSPRYIREKMINDVLQEGEHFIRPFGGRRILFIWENIERDMLKVSPEIKKAEMGSVIPLSRGGVCYG